MDLKQIDFGKAVLKVLELIIVKPFIFFSKIAKFKILATLKKCIKHWVKH